MGSVKLMILNGEPYLVGAQHSLGIGGQGLHRVGFSVAVVAVRWSLVNLLYVAGLAIMAISIN